MLGTFLRQCNIVKSVPVVEFLQEKDCDSTINYSINPKKALTELTLCGKYSFKFLKEVNALTLKGEQWSLQLGLIDFEKKFGFVYFGGAPFIFKWFNQNLKPDQWQHLCYTVTSKEIHVVMNGEVLLNQTHDSPKFALLQPKLMLGGDDESMRLQGKITEVNLWSHALDLEQLISLSTTCEAKNISIPDLFSWKSISTDASNTTCLNYGMIEKDAEFCERSYPKRITVIEYQTNFETSNYMCQSFGGSLFLPKSNNDTEQLGFLIKVRKNYFVKSV